MKNKKIILSVVVCMVVVGGISFWGGVKYSQNTKTQVPELSSRASQGGFSGRNNGGQGMRTGLGGGTVSGEILSKDDVSITVKLRDGGSKMIFFSSSTKFEKTVEGLPSDFVVGKQIMVNGTASLDGSVVANSIQMRPNFILQN